MRKNTPPRIHAASAALAAAALGLALPAHAATYYWKGATGASAYGNWSDLSNWSTESATGADATALPGPTDTFYGLQHRSIDLQGQEWSIGGWNSTGDWNRYEMYLRNGTLNVVNNVTTHSDDIHLYDAKLVFAAQKYGTSDKLEFVPAESDAGEHRQYVHSGGEVDIFGTLKIYKYELYIEGGGTAVIAPTNLFIRNNNAQQSFFRNDGGTLRLPNGLVFESGSTSSAFRFSLIQNSGTLELGGPVSKNGKPGDFRATLSGGTIHATGNVSFDFDTTTIPDNANLTLDIDDGASLDLSGVTVGTGTYVTKTGAGDLAFVAGHMPDTLYVDAGSVLLPSAGSYDLSDVAFSSNGKVKIGAPGITIAGWSPLLLTAGNFVNGIASPVAGSTILTCADASLLARAKAGLDATLPEGFAVAIDGNDLVVTSAYVFNSTTVTDLNDAAGWAGGSVPVGKVVTIMGAGVAPTTTALPNFAGITIQDGASLTISNGGSIPSLTLADSATLAVASGTIALGTAPTISPSGASRPSIAVASGATLNVPGGTTFTDCSLSVSGTLAATSAGDLVLGYAAADETSSFGLAVNGGTLSTTSGDIRFFCPASGGAVSPLGTVAFTGATFSHDDDHGFFFGINNPASTAIAFIFDNTQLNYPKRGYYTISGGSVLRFVNGGSLYRANSQNDKFTLTVSGLASIFLGEGTSSLIGESSNSANSVGNGVMSFSPDTDGFVALVVSNAVWETYHSAGNGKAVAEVFGDSVHTINQDNWNRTQPFNGFKAVNLNAGATLTISNNVDAASLSFSEKFTGAGSLFFSTPRSTTRTFNWNGTDSTATGTLAADATRPTALVIANTATWAGTVVWNGKASIAHSSTADAMTFGGIDLASDFTLRIWGDGSCDHYTLTGAGFASSGGNLVVAIADSSEVLPGDEWVFARVPAETPIPQPSSSAWTISSREVSGDASVVDLVLSVAASSDYTFESDTITDLSNPDGWSTGSVPAGEDVKISGANTVAIVSDASTFPAFGSIAVRNGATLRILADVTLPPLTLDSTAKVIVGDNATAVTAVLDASLVTACNATVTPVALPVIEVATNATLAVASGMKFKNVDFRLYGTVTKASASTSDPSPVFGYADNGETTYLAFTADGGTFNFHADNNSAENGSVSIVYPSSGGTVIPVGTITLRNATRTVTSWADFGNWEFGRNNPTTVPFNVIADGTPIDVAAYLYVSGAAHLSLVNGAYIRRNINCLGHWFPMAIQDAATVSVGEGCFIDFTTKDGSFGIDSQVAVDTVTVRDGGIYNVSYNSSGWARGVFVADDGVLGVGKLYSPRARTDLLRGFGSARLDGDLAIASVNVGTGNTDWDRHTKMANVPFSGIGDVVVSNGVPAYPFSVTMVNGASTATGTIGVADIAGADTALYFADGANWAGTVKADANVALTNLTSAAAPASVSFGGVQLGTGFAVRLWANGDSDRIDIGSNGWTGTGALDFDLVGGFEPVGTETWCIGTQPAGTALPRSRRNTFALYAEPVDGDAGREKIMLKATVGIVILLR